MLLSTHAALLRAAALRIALLVPAACALTGCAGAAGEALGTVQDDALAMNGLPPLALTTNRLVTDAYAMHALLASGLTVDGITDNGEVAAILANEPLAQEFFRYVVGCALPADQSLVFPSLAGLADVTYDGLVGLAPAWGASDGASCDATCQAWVSACVISRVDFLGVHVPLSMRGASPALALPPGETVTYPDREATYFGEVFASPQQIFACRAPEDDQTLIGRPCGDGADVTGCVIDVLPNCNTACSALDPTSGAFSECTAPNGASFGAAVTVYRE